MWNPAEEIDNDDDEDEEEEGIERKEIDNKTEEEEDRFMFFTEIAAEVSPAIDRFFPA